VNDDDQMPPSPLSQSFIGAIEMFQSMQDFIKAGFTPDQAFDLIRSICHGMAMGMAARGGPDVE
jgi:hypothetical protein